MRKMNGVLLALLAVAGCNDELPQASGTTSTSAMVQVGPNGQLAFAPSTVTITVGGSVTWTWQSGPHTVTSGQPGQADGNFCSLPPGTAVSAAACAGTNYAASPPFTYTHTFPTAGRFPYYCTVHGAAMTGTVVVVPAQVTTPTPTPADMGTTTGGGAKTVTVNVGPNNQNAFAPSSVDINVGDTVHWVWQGSPHTVTSGAAPVPDGRFCSNGGAQSVAACSGTGYAAGPGKTYDHTFTTAGSFPYFCTVHGAAMTGVVNVH
jgi:plastocyanin